MVVRVEDVVGSSSAVEEGPSVAEDKSIVCDKVVGVTSIGVEEDVDLVQNGIPLLVEQD